MRCTSHHLRCDRRPRPARTAHSQGGFSLIEIIISVFLISLVVLGLAAGFLTIVRVNGDTANRQRVDQAIGSYTESLTAAQYLPCDDPTLPGTVANYVATDPANNVDPANPGAWVPSPGVVAGIIDVDYWDGTSDYIDTCPGTPTDDLGAQRLTVEVTYRDVARTAQIVVRSR